MALFSGSVKTEVNSNTVLKIGQWEHIAFTLSGKLASIYLNGVLKSSNTNMNIPRNLNRLYCYIGRSNWYPSAIDATADYDEIKIINRAISQVEVLNEFNRID